MKIYMKFCIRYTNKKTFDFSEGLILHDIASFVRTLMKFITCSNVLSACIQYILFKVICQIFISAHEKSAQRTLLSFIECACIAGMPDTMTGQQYVAYHNRDLYRAVPHKAAFRYH